MIEQIKERLASIEKAIQESIVNHNGLLARMDECKVMLDLAAKAADELAPGSPVDNVLDAVDHVVDEVIPAA